MRVTRLPDGPALRAGVRPAGSAHGGRWRAGRSPRAAGNDEDDVIQFIKIDINVRREWLPEGKWFHGPGGMIIGEIFIVV
jgi:hypothetical protein